MSDDLTETIASTLAMSYGSHTHAPQGGKDWKAAEDLVPVIAAELRKAKAEAWDEGFIHCNRPFGLECPETDNPHRTERDDNDE